MASPGLKAISSPDAPKPIGTYSQGIISGRMVYLAGQMGQDPTTGRVVEGGIETQVAQAIRNIEACLKAAGSDLSRVVMRRTFYTDIHAHSGPVSAAWAKVISEPYPASTAVQVGALAMKDALIEIEITAETSN